MKRRLWIGGVLVLLILLGAGGWIYYTIFMTSDFALRHAESFLFRRMTVAKLSEQGTYRFHYVTNRRQDETEAPLKERFGQQREEELKFGFFDTKIEPSLGLGMLINPTEWFQNEEINLLDIQELNEEAFVSQLEELVSASPLRSLLILIHGYREGISLRAS